MFNLYSCTWARLKLREKSFIFITTTIIINNHINNNNNITTKKGVTPFPWWMLVQHFVILLLYSILFSNILLQKSYSYDHYDHNSVHIQYIFSVIKVHLLIVLLFTRIKITKNFLRFISKIYSLRLWPSASGLRPSGSARSASRSAPSALSAFGASRLRLHELNPGLFSTILLKKFYSVHFQYIFIVVKVHFFNCFALYQNKNCKKFSSFYFENLQPPALAKQGVVHAARL